VIGAGIVGAASALALARRGVRVVLVERGSLESAAGSSSGTARIIAPAAYPDDSYLEMGIRALERWRELERVAGERLIETTGVLSRGAFAERQLPALQAAGLEARLVSAKQAGGDLGIRAGEGSPLLLQPGAGVIRAASARRALLRLSHAAGARIHGHEAVRSIVDGGDLLDVVSTSGRRWSCSVAIVAAGPWTSAIAARAGIGLSLRVSRQSVAYFDLPDQRVKPPALIDYDGDEPYALWDPERGLKAALHARGPEVDPSDPGLAADPAAIERITGWVRARWPAVTSGPAGTEACLYTNTPDERFVLERRGRIVIASACNGQGFQLAPETGERVADLASQVTARVPAGHSG
jgi:sarcosine oxidase